MLLAEVSIRRSIFATMLIAALMVFGFFSLPRIGVELFPNVEFPVVTATVVYPGADPETMETKVADPIEEALQSISGVKRMTSRNLEAVTQVVMEFELEVDGVQALQDVRDKISAIERDLPQGIDPPVVQKFERRRRADPLDRAGRRRADGRDDADRQGRGQAAPPADLGRRQRRPHRRP
ncbi:efflux RND transporter permease subunit [Nannocystis pusilla]|uniref:efflux RND transporter permease subunit n=1 Tax=Nannocystis pusilla TaxID=889268 RepID=UPI003DA20415